jgi:hypothetical protein
MFTAENAENAEKIISQNKPNQFQQPIEFLNIEAGGHFFCRFS